MNVIRFILRVLFLPFNLVLLLATAIIELMEKELEFKENS